MIYTSTANNILKFLTAQITTLTPPKQVYLGFSIGAPNDDGSNFNEPDKTQFPSYKRILLNANAASSFTNVFGTVSDGVLTNAKEFMSPECREEAGWMGITHFGIFDTETVGSGTPLYGDVLTDPDIPPDEDGNYTAKVLNVPVNNVAVFRVGSLILKLK